MVMTHGNVNTVNRKYRVNIKKNQSGIRRDSVNQGLPG